MSLPILITGGSQRLGLAVAESLLAHDQPVIITYRRYKPSVTKLEAAGATVMEADFNTQAGISRAIDKIKHIAPALRGIIHNASDWVPENAEQSAADLMQDMMMVHASAPYQLNLALKDALMASSPTDIIHMTDYVQETGSEHHIAYAASKAALHNLTLSFARVFSPHVKVNSIAPSLLMFNDDDSPEYRERALEKNLLGLVPGPQEAVKAVNYLLESEYVTGQTLHLNGGRNLK
ncbi:MAG: dihydromonapterin reductase [Alteromonadaceae bacterium]|nr:dihydromonapterin reductase [Alteromonadaceae bacterium]